MAASAENLLRRIDALERVVRLLGMLRQVSYDSELQELLQQLQSAMDDMERARDNDDPMRPN